MTTYSVKDLQLGASAFTYINPTDPSLKYNVQIENDSMTAEKTKKSNMGFISGIAIGLGYNINCRSVVELSYSAKIMPRAQTILPNQSINASETTIVTKVGDPQRAETIEAAYVAATFKGPHIMQAVNLGLRVSF
jgi:hypothetical protein